MNQNLKKGFTLLEVLLVIAIIAILAGIVILAINPGRQISQANNTQRSSDVNTILNAVWQEALDNSGSLNSNITGTATDICNTSGAGTCTGKIDLSSLVPTYLTAVPIDPGCPSATNCADADSSGYEISVTSSRVTVTAADAELSETISVSR